MHASNGDNVLKLSGHFKGKPDTPAEANNKESFVPLFLKMF
jgi:hypothetical protein